MLSAASLVGLSFGMVLKLSSPVLIDEQIYTIIDLCVPQDYTIISYVELD
jgi:hypothetical protein